MNGMQILLGSLLLLFGRRLFWLAVGILGFLFGFDWVRYQMVDWPTWAAWVAAVGFGTLCAIGTVFLQRVSFGVGGFLAGGYLTVHLLTALGVQTEPAPGLLFVLGGLVGAGLAVLAADWVLVALTSLAGAAAVTGGIGVGPLGSSLAFLGLATMGMAIQFISLRRVEGHPARPQR
jgi:hypothetical protein